MKAWVLGIVLALPWAASAAEPALAPAATFALAERHHGMDGWVVLLADGRVMPATVKQLQDFQWFGFGTPPRVDPPVDLHPLLDARLDLVRDGGRVMASLPLETPFAGLTAISLLPGKGRQFILETSNGGFGQFTGTAGRPFTVEAGRVRFLTTMAGEDIRLTRAARTDWMVLPSTNGKAGEILQATCRPGEAGAAAFAQILESWRLEGTQWRKRSAVSEGYCGWVPGLPALSDFP